jgi:hypothetical protein
VGIENALSRKNVQNTMLDRSCHENTSLGRILPGGAGSVATYLPRGGTGSLSESWERRFFARDSELAKQIYEIRFQKDLAMTDRLRAVSILVDQKRKVEGSRLIHAQDGQCYLLYKPTGDLLNLAGEEYKNLCIAQLQVCPSERDWGVVKYQQELDKCEAMQMPRTPVHSLAFYDEKTGLLAVSDGEKSVWRRERYGEWQERVNGDDGLVFFVDGIENPWIPDFDEPKAVLALAGNLNFESKGLLGRAEQEALLQVYLLSLLFPSLARTRVIPTFLGPKGSGKSSAVRMIGRLFQGYAFEVTDLQEKKEDDYIAAICNSVIVGLDNADSRISWLEDDLAIYATGYEIRKRKLFTTNDLVSFKPRANLLLSSRDPHFRRDDVSQRLLQFYLCHREVIMPEPELYAKFQDERGKVMGSLLSHAGLIADLLAEMSLPSTTFRMADFAAFGYVAMTVMGRQDEWPFILRKLQDVQARFSVEGNPFVESLALLLDRLGGKIERIDTIGLFERCREVAPAWAMKAFRSANSFSRVVTNMIPEIERVLDVKVTREQQKRTTFWRIEKSEPEL